MPTYSYRCAACEHRFDQFQRMADNPLTECPVCGGSVKRVIQPVGVVFKGSGWYITDSRKSTSSDDGTAAGAKAKDKDTDKTDSGAGNGADKTAAKTAEPGSSSGAAGKSAEKAPAAAAD